MVVCLRRQEWSNCKGKNEQLVHQSSIDPTHRSLVNDESDKRFFNCRMISSKCWTTSKRPAHLMKQFNLLEIVAVLTLAACCGGSWSGNFKDTIAADAHIFQQQRLSRANTNRDVPVTQNCKATAADKNVDCISSSVVHQFHLTKQGQSQHGAAEWQKFAAVLRSSFETDASSRWTAHSFAKDEHKT